MRAKLSEWEKLPDLLSSVEDKTATLEKGLKKRGEEVAELRQVVVRKQERIKDLKSQILELQAELDQERMDKRRVATLRAELLSGICVAENEFKTRLSRCD